MINGVVKWFNDQKGFGFVESSGKDYFIHFKEINMPGFKSLKEGDKVSFEATQSPKGPMAIKLVILD
jgi:CspA family cold shock protein